MKAAISISIPELTEYQVALLKVLGLSDHEIQVYTLLVKTQKPMSAQDVASKITIFPNAVYRVYRKLETAGLIYFVSKRPIRYQAVAQSQGFNSAYLNQKTQLEQALELAVGEGTSGHSQTYTIIGRQRMYEEYIRLASVSQKEIAVFAIGIAFSDELYQAQSSAIKRGVYIRHVVQQVKPANYHVISKWQQLGVNLRHFDEDRGFHLTLVDRSVALVTFSDPENTDDRFSVVTHQPFAVRMFQAQFEAVWQQARKIEIYNNSLDARFSSDDKVE